MKVLHTLLLILFSAFSSALFAQQSQNELLKNFEDATLNVFKVENPKYDKFIFTKTKRPWPVSVERSGSGISKLIVNRAGVIEEPFDPDLTEYPAYFKDIAHRVVFVEGDFFYIKWSGGKATLKYVLTSKGSISGSKEDYEKVIETYINNTVKAQSGSRAEIESAKAKEAEKVRIANSLKDKSVKSLSVKWIDPAGEAGHFSKIKYGIEATLSDGTVLRTKNLGGKTEWEDFKIEVTGAEFGEEIITVKGDATEIPNDQILLKVTDKHHPNISIQSKLPLKYNSSVALNFSGKTGGVVHRTISAGKRGQDASSFDISVAKSKTAQGLSIYKVEAKNLSTGDIYRFKIADGYSLTVNARGGNGSFGRETTSGGNGGNGGDVTIHLAPGADDFTYQINNEGGSGGSHDLSWKQGGRGNNGTTNRITNSSVMFSW